MSCLIQKTQKIASSFSVITTSSHQQLRRRLSTTRITSSRPNTQTHIIFGANTDVGKTVITAGLIRASGTETNYVKPLQCGGSDQSDQKFIERHATNVSSTTTLFKWETPASPHYASRIENKPVSDQQVLTAVNDCLGNLRGNFHWIETAGGVLSPSSASPDNCQTHHAKGKDSSWGWVTQADLYRPFIGMSSVVLIGDGRLGGISATLTALESLLVRGYNVAGVLLLETGYENQQAIQEYASSCIKMASSSNSYQNASSTMFSNPDASIVSLPALPPEPEPLTEWYESSQVQDSLHSFVHGHLTQAWEDNQGKNL